MRIYLAARYVRRVELLDYKRDVEAMGHVVTSRWLLGSHEIGPDGLSRQGTPPDRARWAQEDMEDTRAADLVISFTEKPRTSNSRGGRHVEFGAAVAWGKRLMVVGYQENIFHHLPEVEYFESWANCLQALGSSVEETGPENGE